MAWHGWRTIGEAQRYIDEANRIKLARVPAPRSFRDQGDEPLASHAENKMRR